MSKMLVSCSMCWRSCATVGFNRSEGRCHDCGAFGSSPTSVKSENDHAKRGYYNYGDEEGWFLHRHQPLLPIMVPPDLLARGSLLDLEAQQIWPSASSSLDVWRWSMPAICRSSPKSTGVVRRRPDERDRDSLSTIPTSIAADFGKF